MFAHIDSRLPTPLYVQIADRIRVAVASGELAPSSDLPSVRGLATKLRVNPATVVQAYRELEREGLVEMRQGAGSFITDVGQATRERERTAAARRFVRAMLNDATRLGLVPADLRAALYHELPETP